MFMTCYSQKSFVVVCFVVFFLWLFVLNSGVYEMLLKKNIFLLCVQKSEVTQ